MEESKPRQHTLKPSTSDIQNELMALSPEETKTPGTAASDRLDEADPAIAELVIE